MIIFYYVETVRDMVVVRLYIYISKGFNYKRRDDLISSTLACPWCELHHPNKSPILVGEFYRPPNSHVDLLLDYLELDGNLDSALSEAMSCIVLGDFNCDCMPHQHCEC